MSGVSQSAIPLSMIAGMFPHPAPLTLRFTLPEFLCRQPLLLNIGVVAFLSYWQPVRSP